MNKVVVLLLIALFTILFWEYVSPLVYALLDLVSFVLERVF